MVSAVEITKDGRQKFIDVGKVENKKPGYWMVEGKFEQELLKNKFSIYPY
jgi:hypothetical protein